MKKNGIAHKKTAFVFVCSLVVVAICSGPARATDCTNVVLLDASGIPGATHSYTFTARCSASGGSTKDESFGTSKTNNYGVTIDVKGKASWDQKTGKASEAVLVIAGSGDANLASGLESGNFTGKWQAVGTCNQDPFLKDVTANPSCYGMQIQTAVNPPTSKLLDLFLVPKRFLMEKQISSFDAQAMASKHPANPASSTPPPPPPNPKPNIPVANVRDTAGAQGTAKAAPGAVAVLAKPEPTRISDARGAPGGMKAAPGTVAALTKLPSLAVVAHQAIVEPNCQSPKPAMTVKATIRNSGGLLAANQGTIFAREFGGANLSSGEISLPAVGSGQEQTVNIPVITLQPYASLAGSHQVQLKFNPQLVGGQLSFGVPANPYTINVVFPSNFCQAAAHQAPGSAGNSSQRGAGPPPVPSALPKPRKP